VLLLILDYVPTGQDNTEWSPIAWVTGCRRGWGAWMGGGRREMEGDLDSAELLTGLLEGL